MISYSKMKLKSKKNIIIIGVGGHFVSTLNLILSTNEYNVVGLVDSKKSKKDFFGYPVIGTDKDLPQIFKSGIKFCSIGIGQIKNPEPRIKTFNLLKKIGFTVPSLISKNSDCSKISKIGEGTNIFSNTFINANVIIGNNCIINTGSIIEHETNISDNCHISTGCIINGQVKIGKNTFIGSGTVIKNNTEIGNNCIIGMGKIIKKSIKKNVILK